MGLAQNILRQKEKAVVFSMMIVSVLALCLVVCCTQAAPGKVPCTETKYVYWSSWYDPCRESSYAKDCEWKETKLATEKACVTEGASSWPCRPRKRYDGPWYRIECPFEYWQ